MSDLSLVVPQNLAIWGASGHALVVADVIRQQGKYMIVGFLDDINSTLYGSDFSGSTIVGGREKLRELLQSGVHYLIVGVGDCGLRLKLAATAKASGFRLATAVHPRATLSQDAVLGAGSVIVAGAIVNPACRIGESVIINTGATVDHECLIEDGAHVGPGVHLAGKVVIGRGTWVGLGALVKDGVTIGAGSIVGAGSVVLHDLPENVVAYGAPARIIRRLSDNDDRAHS